MRGRLEAVDQGAGTITLDGNTGQDRWEEDGGYSPFTLAVEIAALLAAAGLAELRGAFQEAAYLRDTAELARQCEVEGYYVRIAPPETADAASPLEGFVPIKTGRRGTASGRRPRS